MKINEVEELVGITKKNIRFYEEQGLLSPARNPSNSYRDYSKQDVEQLQRIRLLRKLDIPCETIKKVMTGEISFSECVRSQARKLEKQSSNLKLIQDICTQMSEDVASVEALDALAWLEKVRELEKGGVKFMDTRDKDVRHRRWGSIASALAMTLPMLALLFFIIWGNSQDPLPTILFILLILVPIGGIVCIFIALRMRMKELKRGEYYEAGKY